jgi:predicted metal-dependent phosphotriesterase family hydrolase
MPIHTFAWRELVTGLREHGLTENEIDRMTKVNPARLLGLE